MKLKEIKLPKSSSDLRIKHLSILKNSIFQDKMTLDIACIFVSEFTGVSINEVRNWRLKDIEKVTIHLSNLFASMDIKSLPEKEIVLNGKYYELVNPEKVGIGWHIDFGAIDKVRDPYTLAGVMYVEKGTDYGQVDNNKNIEYPLENRKKEFQEHMPLDVYLRASAFFLTKSLKSTKISLVKQKGKHLGVKIARVFMRGKKAY